MILLDTNVLVTAAVVNPDQTAMAAWLEDQLWQSPRVGFPWESLIGFVRLVTNPRIYPAPISLQAAWGQVRDWLDAEPAWIPSPTEQHAETLQRLLYLSHARTGLIPDAHLAAIALEHGLTVCSLDADFARFPGVKWLNPLAPK